MREDGLSWLRLACWVWQHSGVIGALESLLCMGSHKYHPAVTGGCLEASQSWLQALYLDCGHQADLT